MKKTLFFLALICFSVTSHAQVVLSLDSCRALALRNNKELAMTQVKMEQAKWNRKAAHTHYLPKISLTAGYMRTGDEISLLNKQQKGALNHIGTNAVGSITDIAQQMVMKHPELLPYVQDFSAYLPRFAQTGNALGQSLTDALRTDTRNMTAGAILLTQPLYMGGKIRAYDKITRHQQDLAEQENRKHEQQVKLDVETAYWQIVSLANKHKLATSYRDLLAHLDSNVVKMIAEGVATQSDGLSVSVKLNEAEMTLTKVEDGLTLSRMLLCQICGLPLQSNPVLEDESRQDLPTSKHQVVADFQTALAHRPELSQLATAEQIYQEKVKIERAAFLPQLALTGGYMVSNPNVFNSFEKKFRGTWSVGVMLKVPVWNWMEGKYKVRSARTDYTLARLKADEAREKIELQVHQNAFRVNEAQRKYTLSLKHLDKAEENLRTAQLGFREGVITTSDLLAAQTAWLQAHSNRIDAQIDMKLTRAAYDQSLGL